MTSNEQTQPIPNKDICEICWTISWIPTPEGLRCECCWLNNLLTHKVEANVALQAEIAQLQKWKQSALVLFERYDAITNSIPCEIGGSKVQALADYLKQQRAANFAIANRVLAASGMVRHTNHEDCVGCGCMALSPEEAVAALRVERDELKRNRDMLAQVVEEDTREMEEAAKALAQQKAANLQLAARLAAASESLGGLAERFEKRAYMEGWAAGFWSSNFCRSIGIPPEEMAEIDWSASDSAKRLEQRKESKCS